MALFSSRSVRTWNINSAPWRSSSIGIDQLQRRITLLEQDLVDIRGQLDERTEELDAARAANRELTRALNQAR